MLFYTDWEETNTCFITKEHLRACFMQLGRHIFMQCRVFSCQYPSMAASLPLFFFPRTGQIILQWFRLRKNKLCSNFVVQFTVHPCICHGEERQSFMLLMSFLIYLQIMLQVLLICFILYFRSEFEMLLSLQKNVSSFRQMAMYFTDRCQKCNSPAK